MKKNMLYIGIGYTLCGIAFLLFGILGPEVSFQGLIWGLVGAGTAPGLMMIYRYFYWTRPENVEIYEARMKKEQISLKDERKVMIRARAGQITYQIMFCVLGIAVFISALLQADGIFVMILGLLWILHYLCGLIVYRILSKKM